ncbi:prorelaxin isoform X4 [Artibeus jamaicensis]|uniref:prorelaxin isoform X4 n=1 Tax=Artibeus jamaicensis TaxID=9417 RepID=UPI00235B0708|nr:prorelaxin isoform X4 [Artibeus jamaicensis]
MPRAGDSGTRMPHLFLFHLLGTWLLLSQLPREIQGQEGEIFIKCDREFIHFFIHLCGSHVWAGEMRKQRRKMRSEPSAEIVTFSTMKNAGNLNTIMELIPTLPQKLKRTLDERHPVLKEILQQDTSEDTNLNFEELKENRFHTIGAGHKSVSEFKNVHLAKHFLQKRHVPSVLSSKCCSVGCTETEVAAFC